MDIKKNYYDFEFIDLINLNPNLPYTLFDIKTVIMKDFVIPSKIKSPLITLKKSFLNKINELKYDSNIILTQKIRLSIFLNFIRNEFILKNTKDSYYYFDLPIDNSMSVEIFNLFTLGDIVDDFSDDEYTDCYLNELSSDYDSDSDSEL